MSEEPLYKQILRNLKEKIRTDEIKIGDKLPTELEIAETYDVSRITAKRALTELENEGLIVRKRGAGSFLIQNFSSRPALRTNSEESQMKILFLVPFFDEEGLGEYANHISRQIEEAGYTFFIQQVDSFQDINARDLEKEYAGIIFYPPSRTHFMELFYEFYLDQFPVVLIDKKLDGVPYPAVMPDNLDGCYKATNMLIENGHQNILFIAQDFKSSIPHDQYLGYIKALHEADLSTKHLFDWQSTSNDARRFEQLENLVQYIFEHDISALIAENDVLAVWLIQKLQSFELFVPNDLSVIGFGDIPATKLLSPTVTTVSQPFAQIGKRAAELLIQQIETKQLINTSEFLPIELLVRDSTKKIK